MSNRYATHRGNDYSGVHKNSSVLSHICYSIFKNNSDKFTYEDYFKLWFTTGYLAINASNFEDYEAYVRYSMCRHGQSDYKETVEKTFEEANTSKVNEKEWTYDLQKNCSYIRFDSSECKENEFLEENPSVKMAQKEGDTGVVVSFCSEAVEHNRSSIIVPENIHTNGINPLNWKTDSTVADKSENLGACFVNGDGSVEREIPNLCGAYLDPVRGTLKVTDIDAEDYPPVLDLFEPGNFHIYDYQFFYNNLRQNVLTRLLSWYGCR